MRDLRSPEVSSQELVSVCREMKINKAAIESNTELFRDVFDACIQETMFPIILKRQTLVHIPKGNNAQDASGYRPLCMTGIEYISISMVTTWMWRGESILQGAVVTDLSNPVQIADDAMDKWQQDSANTTTGRWTYWLIPGIGE